MESNVTFIADDAQKSQYFTGPLNLNRKTKQADTVMGTKLPLVENEFEALDLLAAREDVTLTFEQLYTAVWDEGDGTDNRDAAHVGLDNLIYQVNSAGEGFMWIEHKPETGYVFRTRWGHNWKA